LVGCGGGPSGQRTAIGGVGKNSTNSYYCRGEWHYLQTFYEYDETGLASWYGPGFHGKPKPLGEAFNMHGISAAHRTLPHPTVVKVTNLQNGKYIKLVVDDRGPFVYKERIIDLSMGAAKALGIYGKNLATVRVKGIPSESLALSNYLEKNGNKNGKMKDGRTWQQVYKDEIMVAE
jgi:rare lipoprotein A